MKMDQKSLYKDIPSDSENSSRTWLKNEFCIT